MGYKFFRFNMSMEVKSIFTLVVKMDLRDKNETN